MNRKIFFIFLILLIGHICHSPPGACDWLRAAKMAVAKIKTAKQVNFKRDVPSLIVDLNTQDSVDSAVAKALTDEGYALAVSGSFPRVTVKHKEQTHRFWERPYTAYLVELRIKDEGELKNIFKGVDLAFDPAPYQIPVRLFLSVSLAALMYWLIYMTSLYRKKAVWAVTAFIWTLWNLFLAQGYFIWLEWFGF